MTVQKLAKNSIFISLYYIIQKLLFVVFYVVLARKLGDEGVGQFAFAHSFVFLFAIFCDAGLWSLFVKDVARSHEKAKEYLGHMSSISIVVSLLAFLAMMGTAQMMNLDQQKMKLIFVLGLSAILNFNIITFIAVFRAFQELKYEAVLNIIKEGLTLSVSIFLLWKGFDLVTAVHPFLWVSLFILVATIVIVRTKFVKFKPLVNFSKWKDIILHSFPFAINSVAFIFFLRIDKVMLSFFKGDAVVGHYSIAHTLVYGFLAIPFVYSIVIFPTMSQYFDQNDRLKYIFEKSVKLFLVIGMGIGLVGYFLAEDIILTFFGHDFLNSVLIFKIMIWVSILIFFREIYVNLLGAIDKQLVVSRILISMAVFNVVLNALLIPHYGSIGAIVATFLTEFLGLFFGFTFVYRNIAGIALKSSLVKTLCAFPVLIILFILLYDKLSHNLFISIPVYGSIYFIFIVSLKVFDQEEILLLKKAFGK